MKSNSYSDVKIFSYEFSAKDFKIETGSKKCKVFLSEKFIYFGLLSFDFETHDFVGTS